MVNVVDPRTKKKKEEKEKVTPPVRPSPTKPEIIRNSETGKVSGVRLPDGRNFLGIGREGVQGLVDRQTGKIGERRSIEGAVEANPERELPTEKSISKEELRRSIQQDPDTFGLLSPEEQAEIKGLLEVETFPEEQGQQGLLQRINQGAPFTQTGSITGDIAESARRFAASPGAQFVSGLPAGAGAELMAFKIAGQTIFNPKRAVQVGNAVKNQKNLSKAITGLKAVGTTLILAGGGFGLTQLADATINRKLEEQQQALNTLGQITSTVVGDSTTSAGDYREGLKQLRAIKQEILNLESDIKSNSLKRATIKFGGEIIDVNADIFDQLSTVDEGIRDIQSFALEGRFPELTPIEIQQELRKLEKEGIIKPVEFESQRRATSQNELG